MDMQSNLVSIDFDATVLGIAKQCRAMIKGLNWCYRMGQWISANLHLRFDYIFADTWHGKYLMLEEALADAEKRRPLYHRAHVATTQLAGRA